jgi:hypothetical protein
MSEWVLGQIGRGDMRRQGWEGREKRKQTYYGLAVLVGCELANEMVELIMYVGISDIFRSPWKGQSRKMWVSPPGGPGRGMAAAHEPPQSGLAMIQDGKVRDR